MSERKRLYCMFTGGRCVFVRNAKHDFLMAGILVRQIISHKLTSSGKTCGEITKKMNRWP